MSSPPAHTDAPSNWRCSGRLEEEAEGRSWASCLLSSVTTSPRCPWLCSDGALSFDRRWYKWRHPEDLKHTCPCALLSTPPPSSSALRDCTWNNEQIFDPRSPVVHRYILLTEEHTSTPVDIHPLHPLPVFCFYSNQNIASCHCPSCDLPWASAGLERGGDVVSLSTVRSKAKTEISKSSTLGRDSLLIHPTQAEQQICGLHAITKGWTSCRLAEAWGPKGGVNHPRAHSILQQYLKTDFLWYRSLDKSTEGRQDSHRVSPPRFAKKSGIYQLQPDMSEQLRSLSFSLQVPTALVHPP